jgi:hypothetical protein
MKLSPLFRLISAAKGGAGRCLIRGQPTCTDVRINHRRNEATATTHPALSLPHAGTLGCFAHPVVTRAAANMASQTPAVVMDK